MALLLLLRQSLIQGVERFPNVALFPKLWLGAGAKNVAWEPPTSLHQLLSHAKFESSQASKAMYERLFNNRAPGPVVDQVREVLKHSTGVLRRETVAAVSGLPSVAARKFSQQLAYGNPLGAMSGHTISKKLQFLGAEAAHESTRAWGYSTVATKRPWCRRVQTSLQKLKQRKAVVSKRGYSSRGTAGADAVLYGTIVVNLGVWQLWQLPGWQALMQKHFVCSVDSIMSMQMYKAISANFSHIDWMHLAKNMIVLYIFGQTFGREYGGKAFLGLYLAGGIGCAAGHYLYYTQFVPWKEGSSQRFYDPRRTPSYLGASGSVSAIVTCSICLAPFRTYYIYGIIPMRAFVLGALLIGMDVYGAWIMDKNDPVAYCGHLGGAAVGLVAALHFALRRRRIPIR